METEQNLKRMRAGIASDNVGIELKAYLVHSLKAVGYEVEDFSARELIELWKNMEKICMKYI